MRWTASLFVTLAVLADAGATAEACVSHGAPPLVKVPKGAKSRRAAVEPVRVLVVGVDMGRRFLKTLGNIGHTVDVARDAQEVDVLTARHQYDIAVAGLTDAHALLNNLAIATVVPVSEDPSAAADFTFVIPSDPDALRAQIHILHHALDHRPQTGRALVQR